MRCCFALNALLPLSTPASRQGHKHKQARRRRRHLVNVCRRRLRDRARSAWRLITRLKRSSARFYIINIQIECRCGTKNNLMFMFGRTLIAERHRRFYYTAAVHRRPGSLFAPWHELGARSPFTKQPPHSSLHLY